MKRILAKNGVVFYRSSLIPCVHGFSTRIGGVSMLPHTQSLNLGVDRGDEVITVRENLSRFGAAVGFRAEQVISVAQIHSTKIRYVTEQQGGEGYFSPETEACDGYVTDRRGVVLGVRTADCVPILLYAPSNSSGFAGGVAAVHAGWRGTAGRIVNNAVDALCVMGAEKETVKAAVGPAIGPCCYEVQQDFTNQFQEMLGKSLTERFVVPHEKKTGVWRADLLSINRALLLEAGVPSESIDLCPVCTCCYPKEFYSHRYSKGVRGTMLSVISLESRINEE